MERLSVAPLRAAASISLCALLLGCATPATQAPSQPQGWAARQAVLAGLQNWAVDGRIAVNQGSQGWQASVRWREQPERYAIDLIGPLGQGRALIEGTPAGVRMQTERDVLSAAEPDSLLAQATGMQVPISGLRYWIRGLPDPSQPSRPSVDERGRLRRLEQNGWMIEYPNYIQVNGLELPKRIHAQQGELEVKLFIQTWTL